MSELTDRKMITFVAQVAPAMKIKEEIPFFMVTMDRQGAVCLYRADGVSEDVAKEIMRQITGGKAIRLIGKD